MTTLVQCTIIFLILGGMGGVHSQAVTIKMGILLSGNGWKTGNDSYPAAEIAIKDLEEYSQSWDRRKFLAYFLEFQCHKTNILNNDINDFV